VGRRGVGEPDGGFVAVALPGGRVLVTALVAVAATRLAVAVPGSAVLLGARVFVAEGGGGLEAVALGRGVSVAGSRVGGGVSVGTAVSVGGSGVQVAVGSGVRVAVGGGKGVLVAVAVGARQISLKGMAGGSATSPMVASPQAQPSTPPARTV
jgi:hypothetical protein